jgi:hypothetical protein
MITPGMVSDGKKIIVAASAYAWQFGSPLTAVAVDEDGNARDLVPPGRGNTAAMLFAQPEYNSAIIGIPIQGASVVAYQSEPGTPHAFAAAFVEPTTGVRPAQLMVPTLLYESGKRVYFFQKRSELTPLPSEPSTLRRLTPGAVVALPTPLRETHSRWEIQPNDFGNLTLDPYMLPLPAQAANVDRIGRVR